MLLNDLQVRAILAATRSRALMTRAWLLDACTVTNGFDVKVEAENPKVGSTVEDHTGNLTEIKEGIVIGVGEHHVGIVLENKSGVVQVAVLSDGKNPIFHRFDVLAFNPALFKEYLGVNPMTDSIKSGPLKDKDGMPLYATTLGRWLENMFCFQYPTNFKSLPYYNEMMTPATMIDRMTNLLINKKITVDEYESFDNNFFFLNHITEISVPSLTERSLVTNPKVKEFKKKFIAEHKDQMTDPLVVKQLEDELIKLDKEWLGQGTDHEDASVLFFDGLGKKSYNLHRKKLLLTTGGVPAFDESTGKYDFIANSLDEGWTIKDLPSRANETRKGSYDRGMETAKGGAETKLVVRVFQDLTVSIDDCGTKKTIKVDFAKQCRIKDFIGRTIRVGSSDIVITEDNMAKYDGKVVDMYSPLTCQCKGDLCFKCCGLKTKEFYGNIIGVQVVNITSKFMQTAMKSMHGTVLQVVQPKLEDIFL
jgi:hypothetical protein